MTIAEQLIEKGRAEGILIGYWIGFSLGRIEGMAIMLKRQLKIKFGDVSEQYLKRIEEANADTLLNWGENMIYAFTIEDVFN